MNCRDTLYPRILQRTVSGGDISLHPLTQPGHLHHLVIVSYTRLMNSVDITPNLMEVIMKAYTLISAAIISVALSTGAYAQPVKSQSDETRYFSDVVSIHTTDLEKAEMRYAACLSTGNDGVVESALAHVAMLKLMYPVKDFKTVMQKVKSIEETASSAELRYKAYLVRTLFSNPKQFAADARTSYDSPDDLFGTLANRLNRVIADGLFQ